MPDTPRTRSELVALFATNTTGDIGAQDLRDFLSSVSITTRGSGAPTANPEQVGDTYYDETNDILYVGIGTGSSPTDDDWKVFYPQYQVELNEQSGAFYTVQSSDIGGMISCESASANVVSIPTGLTNRKGATFSVVQYGAGAVTIEGGVGVTINGVASDSPSVAASLDSQYSLVTMVNKDGADEWLALGGVGTFA